MKKYIGLFLVAIFCFFFSGGIEADSEIIEEESQNQPGLAENANATLRAAYNGGNAISYANAHAFYYSTYYRKFPGADCANFVSQCIFSGGMPQESTWRYALYYDINGNHVSYLDQPTLAWKEANYFKDWFKQRSTRVGNWSKNGTPDPYKTYAYVNNSSNFSGNGRTILMYDWTGDGYIDHLSICVSTGVSQDSDDIYNGQTPYGDLINQHTADRYKAIWHGDRRNPDRATTRIYGFTI